MSKDHRKLADFFSAFSDETRLTILSHLLKGSFNVNEILDKINFGRDENEKVKLPAISYQLKILRKNDLVSYKKEGRKKFFRLADKHIVHILSDAITHISGDHSCEDITCNDLEIIEREFPIIKEELK